MKRKQTHITKFLSVVMLLVFAIAVIPASLFHDHEPQHFPTTVEKHCMHKQHVKSVEDTCLICAVHFDKHFTISKISFSLYIQEIPVVNGVYNVSTAYTALISTSLRGPPAIA